MITEIHLTFRLERGRPRRLWSRKRFPPLSHRSSLVHSQSRKSHILCCNAARCDLRFHLHVTPRRNSPVHFAGGGWRMSNRLPPTTKRHRQRMLSPRHEKWLLFQDAGRVDPQHQINIPLGHGVVQNPLPHLRFLHSVIHRPRRSRQKLATQKLPQMQFHIQSTHMSLHFPSIHLSTFLARLRLHPPQLLHRSLRRPMILYKHMYFLNFV